MNTIDEWEELPEIIIIDTPLIQGDSDISEHVKFILEKLDNLGCVVKG